MYGPSAPVTWLWKQDKYAFRFADKIFREWDASYVYVISDGELVKVGHSAKPEKRLADLQVANGKRLALVAKFGVKHKHHAPWIERLVHSRLREHSASGEWFRVDAVVARDVVVSTLANQYFHTDGEELSSDVVRMLMRSTMDALFGGVH